jgi:hypothetical protein
MKIHSIDKKSWFAVKPVKDNSYTAISVEAQIDIGHGVFNAKNIDMHFLNLAVFTSELDNFLTDRSILPRLNGTYDSFIEISGSVSHVFIKFCIGDADCGAKTHQYNLFGSFEIDQEYLAPFIKVMKSIKS